MLNTFTDVLEFCVLKDFRIFQEILPKVDGCLLRRCHEHSKWSKAKVYVFADSVLCVGKTEQNPGAADAKWTGQVADLKRYSSYRDAVGLDGKAIEFEWQTFPVYNIDYSQGNAEGLGEEEHRSGELQRPDHLYFNVQRHRVEKEWWDLNLERRESQELLNQDSARTLDISGSRFGKEMVR